MVGTTRTVVFCRKGHEAKRKQEHETSKTGGEMWGGGG